jgi:hypothetical protein
MINTNETSRRDYLWLGLLLLGLMAVPYYWLLTGSYMHWEVVQVSKMLDYGFWERRGAMLASGWYAGWTPDPASHNYVNHPYPVVWIYALLCWLFGKAAVYVLVALRALATIWLTYAFLAKLFSRKIALPVTALLVTSHATIEFAMNCDIVGQGVIVWPVAGLLALRMRERPSRGLAFALGLSLFVAGQISWLALSVAPVLLLLCLPPTLTLAQALRRPWAVPGWLALLVGGCASFAVFIGQVLVYSPALEGNAQYLSIQMGMGGPTRLQMLPVLLLRMLLASAPLWLGAILCLLCFGRIVKNSPFGRASLVYFLIFFFVLMAVPRLLFLNQHGFSYLMFPCALIVAVVLHENRGRWIPYLMAAIALPGLLFCYAKMHDYRPSNATLTLGAWLAQNTPREGLIFTNFKHLTPPVPDWDGEFLAYVAFAGDRVVINRVANQSEFKGAAGELKEHFPYVYFLQETTQPIEPQWETNLEQQATAIVRASLPVAPEQPRYFKLARVWLWSLLGGSAPHYATAAVGESASTNSFSLKLYQLPENFMPEQKRAE